MTENEMKQANREFRCKTRGEFHERNRAEKREREKTLREVLGSDVAFQVIEEFLQHTDLAKLEYSDRKRSITLIRKNPTIKPIIGFARDIVLEDEECDDGYENESEVRL